MFIMWMFTWVIIIIHKKKIQFRAFCIFSLSLVYIFSLFILSTFTNKYQLLNMKHILNLISHILPSLITIDNDKRPGCCSAYFLYSYSLSKSRHIFRCFFYQDSQIKRFYLFFSGLTFISFFFRTCFVSSTNIYYFHCCYCCVFVCLLLFTFVFLVCSYLSCHSCPLVFSSSLQQRNA